MCSACGLKIETAAHQTATDIVRRIEKLKSIMKTSDDQGDQELLLQRLQKSTDDEVLFAVDLGSVLKDLLKLEKVVNSVPHAEELEKQLHDSQVEIDRLKQTEAELNRLRVAYRKLASQ